MKGQWTNDNNISRIIMSHGMCYVILLDDINTGMCMDNSFNKMLENWCEENLLSEHKIDRINNLAGIMNMVNACNEPSRHFEHTA
jgi:hypothetical protein